MIKLKQGLLNIYNYTVTASMIKRRKTLDKALAHEQSIYEYLIKMLKYIPKHVKHWKRINDDIIYLKKKKLPRSRSKTKISKSKSKK